MAELPTMLQHGQEALDVFVDKLNSMYTSITFTVEQKKEGQLPFLDILINKHPDGSVGRTVYRKATHTELYLNKNSHHPAQKHGVIKTLLERVH